MKDVTTGVPEMLVPLFAAIVNMERIMGPRIQIQAILGGDQELMDAWRDISVGAQIYIATCDDRLDTDTEAQP